MKQTTAPKHPRKLDRSKQRIQLAHLLSLPGEKARHLFCRISNERPQMLRFRTPGAPSPEAVGCEITRASSHPTIPPRRANAAGVRCKWLLCIGPNFLFVKAFSLFTAGQGVEWERDVDDVGLFFSFVFVERGRDEVVHSRSSCDIIVQ